MVLLMFRYVFFFFVFCFFWFRKGAAGVDLTICKAAQCAKQCVEFQNIGTAMTLPQVRLLYVCLVVCFQSNTTAHSLNRFVTRARNDKSVSISIVRRSWPAGLRLIRQFVRFV
jgi:hypothetical protein